MKIKVNARFCQVYMRRSIKAPSEVGQTLITKQAYTLCEIENKLSKHVGAALKAKKKNHVMKTSHLTLSYPFPLRYFDKEVVC